MKKIWNQTLPLVASGIILSGFAGGWNLIRSEINFHREVRADIALIKEKLGIQPTKESESHVAVNN
jgi:hypothetical protein